MDELEYSVDGLTVERDQFAAALPDDHDVEYELDGRSVSREEFAAVVREVQRRVKPLLEILDPRGEFLRGRGANITSQFGEDGLIAAALERIGARNRWCFEVGAADGVELSNTKALRDAGWSALLIEADEALYEKLVFEAIPDRVRCMQFRIGPYSLDRLLDAVGAPADLDFGIIDIDGQDYYAFAGLAWHRPRILLVEYNQQDAEIPPIDGSSGQAGLTAILALGRSKRYVPLARTNVNVLFLAEEEIR